MTASLNLFKLSFLLSLLSNSGLWPETLSNKAGGVSAPPTCSRIECPSYEVIHVGDGYEIRRYNSTVWMSTSPIQDISLVESTRTGFLQLFDYIQGKNKFEEKIEMTAPVITQVMPSDGPFCVSSFVVSFYVPKENQASPPPAKGLHAQRWEPIYAAVRQFSGFVSDSDVGEEAAALHASLSGTVWSAAIAKSHASEIATEYTVIDLQDFPSQSQKLIDASQEWGCFRIINHQIPTTLMSDMKSVVRSLLDLPPEIKRRNTDVIAGSGYVAPNKVNPLYEGLGLYDIGSTHAVLDFCTQLDASPQQRNTILRYSQSIHKLAMDIGNKLAQSMGLASDLFMGWPCQFRINKYSFTPETLGSSGVQIHTDSGFLTILQDDENVGGLEVMDKKSGEFVPVDPMPGTLLVNLGDFATVWSNGRFYNVKHRVQCKEATIRLSIALFVLGPKEAPLEAPPELVDSENHPRLYVPINFEDYRKLRLSTGLRAGEALDKLSASNVPF